MDGRKNMSTSITVYTPIDLLINAYRRSINSVKEDSDQSLTFCFPMELQGSQVV